MQKFPLVVILDNIRSAYNVGSVLRTAECAGITGVYTCGYTPNAAHPKVRKTALDAEEWVESKHFASLEDCINQLISEKFNILALESNKEGQNIWTIDFPNVPTAIILGNEIEGVQLNLLEQFTEIKTVEVPMFGQKESLNVANTAAIAIYEIIRRWNQ